MTQDIIVAKFGGTSMADATAIRQSAGVALQNHAGLVVVSATAGTTNQLLELATLAARKKAVEAEKILAEINQRHLSIAQELKAEADVIDDLRKLLESLALLLHDHSNRTDKTTHLDAILAIGEQLSSNLMLAALRAEGPAELVDARQLIKTDAHHGAATPQIEQIAESCAAVLKPKLGKTIVVTQGFIGSAPDGSTTTLGRGGSDYSAALLAEALAAKELQIWTDVAGITSCDPRLVPHAQQIAQLTFQEAAELAIAGAKILYPRMITPLRRARIQTFVGNTFEPQAGGTIISGKAEQKPVVRAIAIKQNQRLLTLTTPEMANQFGYLAKIFEVFAKFKMSIDQISTSEISVAVILEDKKPSAGLIQELETLGDISIEEGFSVVSLIGNNVTNTPGLVQEIFSTLTEHNHEVVVRMICQGASQHNFCLVVNDAHGQTLVRRLHADFIESSSKHLS